MVGSALSVGCSVCGHLSCVCAIKSSHDEACAFRRAPTCAVGIECEHGRDVCPICDRCTCGPKFIELSNGESFLPGRFELTDSKYYYVDLVSKWAKDQFALYLASAMPHTAAIIYQTGRDPYEITWSR